MRLLGIFLEPTIPTISPPSSAIKKDVVGADLLVRQEDHAGRGPVVARFGAVGLVVLDVLAGVRTEDQAQAVAELLCALPDELSLDEGDVAGLLDGEDVLVSSAYSVLKTLGLPSMKYLQTK